MKPALLADENIPAAVVAGLRASGYDVLALAECAPGTPDRAVLALARKLGRCLLSFDGDFGDLIFRDGEAAPSAVYFLRLHPIEPQRALALALRALAAGAVGGFIVVTEEGERRRPFLPVPDREAHG